MSLPSRERGLKFVDFDPQANATQVAPLAGAWIEIGRSWSVKKCAGVAPLAGAWIEIKTGGYAYPI